MDKATLLKKVRLIEIKTRGLSTQLFSGEYHSAFKGRGMSFSEVREYTYGDDVRNIDWNVSARMHHPYIKVFEEERELTVMLLIDISRSAYYGTHQQTKNELITEISAVLSFSAINNNDKVGVILFSDRIEKFIPPKKGKSHILRIISDLLETKPDGTGTDIALLLEYFSNVVRKRSIAFLFSDFMDNDYLRPLRIAAKKHDLIGVRLFDPTEAQLPDAGLVQMQDSETGELIWVDTSSAEVRKQYHRNYLQRVAGFEANFARCGADTIAIATNQPYMPALHGFFRKRMQRR
ncbi:MAG TPA: DUF58 domain-containing protein [Bacteroidetes bacterium]|nr:DUF58 domain-containing protein [Bacteroidota bacterium]HAE35167.1 DUF58 domain-containing protein [Bacteroidota bacterium]HPR28707.1 DUF58 domain-containing protein [Chitinophagales bacterium]HQU38771.1 DUF58 domain-containing protein [Chitinophagales bacterium]HQU75749.1 DUF58 domain-containing protein [Chitinophagales bacterium]